MTLKMDSRDDRIGRSVSLGEMMGFSGVMPPSANRCGGNRGERDDEAFDLSGFRNRLASGLERGVETSLFVAPRLLKAGTSVDDALGGGVGLGGLSVIGGAHEDVSNVLAHAVLRLSEQCAVLYVLIREREEDADVPQVYVSKCNSREPRPAKLLKGFAKVTLSADEKTRVSVHLGKDAFSHYDVASGEFRVSPGVFEVIVGANAREESLKTSLTIE